jgi:hypothetical protein
MRTDGKPAESQTRLDAFFLTVGVVANQPAASILPPSRPPPVSAGASRWEELAFYHCSLTYWPLTHWPLAR